MPNLKHKREVLRVAWVDYFVTYCPQCEEEITVRLSMIHDQSCHYLEGGHKSRIVHEEDA